MTPEHRANCMQIFRNKKLLYLYGDPAYRGTFGVISPYKGHIYLNREQLKFNKALAEVRVAVVQSVRLTSKAIISHIIYASYKDRATASSCILFHRYSSNKLRHLHARQSDKRSISSPAARSGALSRRIGPL